MKLIGALVLLLGVSASAVELRAQCLPFSPDAKCQAKTGPQLRVDFGADLKRDVVARPQASQVESAPTLAQTAQPMDCKMVRPAPASTDPKMVKPIPQQPGVKHTARVIDVPPCPVK